MELKPNKSIGTFIDKWATRELKFLLATFLYLDTSLFP